MRGFRNFCQFYLVLRLFYSLKSGSNGFIAEKTILILYKGSRGGPLFSGGGGLSNFSQKGGPNANCLQFVIVVFPDHTHLLFSIENTYTYMYTYLFPYTYLLFPRGGGIRTLYPPLDPHMGNVIITGQYLSQSGL